MSALDLSGGDAGSAALPAAFDLFMQEDQGGQALPQQTPTPAPAPASAETLTAGQAPGGDMDAGELTPFTPIDPPKPGAQAAPPATTETIAPVDEGVPDHVVRKGAEAVNTWKAARLEAKQLKQKLEDIERDRSVKEVELSELKQKLERAPSEDKLKELESKVAKYEDELGRIDITRSKHFKDQYERPVNELFSKVVKTFMKAGRDERRALELARSVFRPGMSDPNTLERAIPEESSVVIGAISTLLEDRDVLVAKYDEAVQNWRQTREAAQAEESRQAASEIGSMLTKSAQQAFTEVSKDGSWLFTEGEDEEWNKGVKARKDAVMGYLRAGQPSELARLIAEGVASPVYRRGYETIKVAYDDLMAKYQGLVGRRPGVASHSADRGTPAPVGDAPKSVADFVDREW